MNWRCFFRHKWQICRCERCGQTRASDHRAHRWQGCRCQICGITRHRLVSGICTECRVRILQPRSMHFGSSSAYDTALTAHACLKPEPAVELQRTQAGTGGRNRNQRPDIIRVAGCTLQVARILDFSNACSPDQVAPGPAKPRILSRRCAAVHPGFSPKPRRGFVQRGANSLPAPIPRSAPHRSEAAPR